MKRLSRSVTGFQHVALLMVGFAMTAFAVSVHAAEDAKPNGKPPAAKEVKPDAKTETKPEAKPDAKPSGEDASKPHKVKKGPFRIEVNLDGVFEAQNMAELAVRPQEWLLFTVLKAVEHGTTVKQGDLVLQLDTEKIDRAIVELRAELQINEVSLKQAEEQMAALEKVAPLDAEANERARRMVQEDWKQYLEVDKPLSLKSADMMLESAKDSVEYQEEELKQLEKMYKADDLTEETEKIVLKRARDAVKRAQFGLERSKAAHAEMLKFVLPRYDEKVKDATARAEIEFNRTKVVLPLAVSKQRLDLEKLKIVRTQADERLKKLLADREAMTLKAPMDGIVYYGRCSRGKWVTGPAGADVLRRGVPVLPNDVVMTVVQPRPLTVRTTVPEAQIQLVPAGLQGTVEPTALKHLKLTGIVQKVSSVPLTGGGFDATLTVAVDGEAAIMPGMGCGIKLTPYRKTDAITVPPKAVFSEELDPLKQYVYVLGKGGKAEKRSVSVGKRNESQVEVLQGLGDGDQVLLEKPKEP